MNRVAQHPADTFRDDASFCSRRLPLLVYTSRLPLYLLCWNNWTLQAGSGWFANDSEKETLLFYDRLVGKKTGFSRRFMISKSSEITKHLKVG